MDIDQDIPHAVGSVVTVPGGAGAYLVAAQSYDNCGTQPANYTLRGHPELGTEPGTSAWHSHRDVAVTEEPSPRSWALLKDAVRLDRESRTVNPRP